MNKKKIAIIFGMLAAVMIFTTGCGMIEGQNYTLYKYIDTVYNLAPQNLIADFDKISELQAPMAVATIIMPCTYELQCTINYSYSAYYTGSKPGSGAVQKVNASLTNKATAFVIDADGYLITNAHVITLENESELTDLKYESWDIKINLAETDTFFTAYVIAYDRTLDLAVLRVDPKEVNVATLEYAVFYKLQDPLTTEYPTVKLYYGEPVVAVGNSCGYGLAVTRGVVSAPNRYFSDGTGYTAAIQIDAAINEGNSGGPLCNVYGRVVGMTTTALSPENAENVNFAIPSYTILAYLDSLNSKTSDGVILDGAAQIKYYYTTLRVYSSSDIFCNFS